MRQRKPEGLADHLRRRRGPEELTAAPGRGAGAAPELCSLLQRDEPMRKSGADGLHRTRVFPLLRGKGHAPGNEHARKVGTSGERHHHCGKALVAGSNSENASSRGQRTNQPAKYLGCIITIREAVHHPLCSLSSSITGIGAIAGERRESAGLQFLRCRPHQKADLPVTGVVSESYRLPIGRANAALRAQDQELFASQLGGFPAHAGVL